MTGKPPSQTREAQTREERLAAKLRENLHRRKAQARELGGPTPESGNTPGLSKSPAKS